MRVINIRLSIAAVALSLFVGGASAQTEHQHEQKTPASQKTMQHEHGKQGAAKMDMSEMMAEPHHVLTMAYVHNIATFAKALRDHATANSTLNAEFSRAAASEIKRSFDQMEKHHKEHIQMMSEDMRSKMSAMMTEVDKHRAALRDAVTALEKDVKADSLDAKRVAADSSDILKHIDEMSKMHEGKSHKM